MFVDHIIAKMIDKSLKRQPIDMKIEKLPRLLHAVGQHLVGWCRRPRNFSYMTAS